MSDDEFEARWAEIAADLSDIDPVTPDEDAASSPAGSSSPSSPFPEPSRPPSSDSAAAGPRDWRPDEESDDEDQDDLDAVYEEVAAVARASRKQAPPSSRHSTRLWVACVLAIVVSLLMAFNVLPGGGMVAGVLGLVGFVCGALAAFASSTRGNNPYDDGARL